MATLNRAFTIALFTSCCSISSSSCQTGKKTDASAQVIFEATTPCDELSKSLLRIPESTKCEMMKWKLTLDKDSKTSTLTNYNLICTYGVGKQGTREFMEGAMTKELEGKLTVAKGIAGNREAEVYQLQNDSSQLVLFFLKVGENLLHLLDGNKHLMVGTGAWSYTLNRMTPAVHSTDKLFLTTTSQISGDSAIAGIFSARTPCIDVLRHLNKISEPGCQIVKCQLRLYQDTMTHAPSTFLLYTIYVGKGDTRYSNTGTWRIGKGIKNDPDVRTLQLDFDNAQTSMLFVIADENILFMLDEMQNLLVGGEYCGFTFNRKKE